MIYCIWYPSGGFGHFVNAVLSLHGDNFVRPVNQLEFSTTGDSHSLELVAPKYFHDEPYHYNFLDNVNYSVLIDNGINNEGKKFTEVFPKATIIKLCYDNYSWPIVAKTMIDKAMRSSIEDELGIEDWATDETWARREKYFLFLRDHALRFKWQEDKNCININITNLTDYNNFKMLLINSGVSLSSFRHLWDTWLAHNFQYFTPVRSAQTIIESIKDNKSLDLSMITDIWTQSVIYYYIWLEFGVEMPHNDYADWTVNSNSIADYLKTAGVL
jgi:hypothetical protein